MALPPFLANIIGWLRSGYPEGVPEADYVPLLAILTRRLSDAEVDQITAELIAQGDLPVDKTDIQVLITKITNEMPRIPTSIACVDIYSTAACRRSIRSPRGAARRGRPRLRRGTPLAAALRARGARVLLCTAEPEPTVGEVGDDGAARALTDDAEVAAWVALGIGAVVAASATMFMIIKSAGAVYLIYLGVQAIRHRHRIHAGAGSGGEGGLKVTALH